MAMDWGQWRTILWLRWRLTRNQWSRLGAINEAAGILLGLFLSCGIVLSSGLGLLLGARAFAKAPPHMLLFLWDAAAGIFLFFWLIGLLTEIQRSESLDLARLMHLPISVRSIFFFNYLASWFTPSILIALPGFVCLAVGLALSRSPWMLLLLPVIGGFFCLVTAWTYLLRGWLVSLMVNERRRRTILIGVSLFIMVIVQLPNFYFNILRPKPSAKDSAKTATPEWVSAAHFYLPPLWLAQAARTLDQGQAGPALLAAVAGFSLGGLGLLRAYRGTLRFHQAAGTGKRVPSPPVPSAKEKPSRFLQMKIPGIPEEAAAVAAATFRSHLRAPEVKMAMFGQVVMFLIFGVLFFRGGAALPTAKFQAITGAMIVMLSLFGAVQIFFNQFGFDREGFRAYVLAPISRQHLLLGKTLAVFPLITATGLLILGCALGFGLIGPMVFLASLLTFAAGFLLFSTLGNWLSIVAPYRIAHGSLKPTKVPPKVTLMILLGMVLSPVAGVLIFFPATLELVFRLMDWPGNVVVNLVSSALLLMASAGIYRAANGPLGRLLQRREQRVLQAVTREIE